MSNFMVSGFVLGKFLVWNSGRVYPDDELYFSIFPFPETSKILNSAITTSFDASTQFIAQFLQRVRKVAVHL
jgi:hypothetical protein